MTWWESLGTFESIMYATAGISSLLFILRLILLFFIGDTDLEAEDAGMLDVDGGDTDGAMELAETHDLRLFSSTGILGFLCVGSWSSLYAFENWQSVGLSSLVFAGSGLVVLFGVAYLMRGLLSLQEDTTVKLSNAVGNIADVYLRIPPHKEGMGKVHVLLHEQIREYRAISLDDSPIETGAKVRVIGVEEDNVLLVQRVSEEWV